MISGFSLEKNIGDGDQIASGLAYSVIVHHPLGELSKSDLTEIPSLGSVVKILKEIRDNKEYVESFDSKNRRIMKRIHSLQQKQSTMEKLSKYDLNVKDSEENIQKMMDILFKLAYFMDVHNFFIIHMITSFRSIKSKKKNQFLYFFSTNHSFFSSLFQTNEKIHKQRFAFQYNQLFLEIRFVGLHHL